VVRDSVRNNIRLTEDDREMCYTLDDHGISFLRFLEYRAGSGDDRAVTALRLFYKVIEPDLITDEKIAASDAMRGVELD
jgi:hypothetical protein